MDLKLVKFKKVLWNQIEHFHEQTTDQDFMAKMKLCMILIAVPGSPWFGIGDIIAELEN